MPTAINKGRSITTITKYPTSAKATPIGLSGKKTVKTKLNYPKTAGKSSFQATANNKLSLIQRLSLGSNNDLKH